VNEPELAAASQIDGFHNQKKYIDKHLIGSVFLPEKTFNTSQLPCVGGWSVQKGRGPWWTDGD
jgi:hypothetical protein